MKNKRVKQMICDVLEFVNPAHEENPVYRHKFGRFYCLDENDTYQIQPYQLCSDGLKLEQGAVSLTANQLKAKNE